MKKNGVSDVGLTTVHDEVNLALIAGFNDDFVMNATGDLQCRTNGAVYRDEQISRMYLVPCVDGGVYFITTHDGHLGLLFEELAEAA